MYVILYYVRMGSHPRLHLQSGMRPFTNKAAAEAELVAFKERHPDMQEYAICEIKRP